MWRFLLRLKHEKAADASHPNQGKDWDQDIPRFEYLDAEHVVGELIYSGILIYIKLSGVV